MANIFGVISPIYADVSLVGRSSKPSPKALRAKSARSSAVQVQVASTAHPPNASRRRRAAWCGVRAPAIKGAAEEAVAEPPKSSSIAGIVVVVAGAPVAAAGSMAVAADAEKVSSGCD
jgi:hypothetical protein